MSLDAMKQALEALEVCEVHGYIPVRLTQDSVLALRLAIEQAERLEKEPTKILATEEMLNSAGFYKAEKQEPVAWANINKHGDITHTSNKQTAWAKTPLYTAPPQQEKQEPVGWITQAGLEVDRTTLFSGKSPAWRIPVYTAPPQRQPSGSFVAWDNTLCNPLAPCREQNLSAWEDGYASGIKDQRQPLTEEEIDELARTMVKGERSVNWLARAIERKHGIGGGE